MSDTSEKVAMAIRNERRFACVMDCKCDDRQLAEAAIAAMPKLSAEARAIFRRHLDTHEGVFAMAFPDHPDLAVMRAARAWLEAMP